MRRWFRKTELLLMTRVNCCRGLRDNVNAFGTGIQFLSVGTACDESIAHHDQAVDRFLNAGCAQAMRSTIWLS